MRADHLQIKSLSELSDTDHSTDTRDERRVMQKAIHKTCDKNFIHTLTAMLMSHWRETVSDFGRTIFFVRSFVGRWINRFDLTRYYLKRAK